MQRAIPRRATERAIVAAAVLLAACGYPDFAFDGAAPTDSSADDAAIDSTFAPDARDDASSDTAREGAASDSGVDAPTVDSGDSGDSGVDAPVDTTDPCTLVDDMEDGSGFILHICGRSGSWYTFNDGTDGGVQTPPEGTLAAPDLIPDGGRAGSKYAEHTFGSGFTNWGAGIGFNFVDGGPSFDVSKYSGVRFWAKSSPDKAYPRFAIADRDTDGRGGVCGVGTAGACGDHWGLGLVVGTDWALQTVKFSDLKQVGWGNTAPTFDAAHAYGVNWQIPSGSSFDLWIDDISFVP